MADKSIKTTIANGELVIECANRKLVVRPSDFAAEIQQAAMLHGFKQKIGDAAALSRSEDTGKPATDEEKYFAMKKVEEQLREGEWNRRATGDGTANMGLLVLALMRVTGQEREACEVAVKGWSPDQQRVMRESAAIAPVIGDIKAERAKAAAMRGTGAKVDDFDPMAALAKLTGKAEPAKTVKADGPSAAAHRVPAKKAA